MLIRWAKNTETKESIRLQNYFATTRISASRVTSHYDRSIVKYVCLQCSVLSGKEKIRSRGYSNLYNHVL